MPPRAAPAPNPAENAEGARREKPAKAGHDVSNNLPRSVPPLVGHGAGRIGNVMASNNTAGFSRRALLETSAGLGAGVALAGMLQGRTARADTPTLNMWWWGEQELPGLQGFVDDSVKSYSAATVKPMLQDTAVVISQFQTAAAAGQAPDIQFLWNGIYHMESVWLGYLGRWTVWSATP